MHRPLLSFKVLRSRLHAACAAITPCTQCSLSTRALQLRSGAGRLSPLAGLAPAVPWCFPAGAATSAVLFSRHTILRQRIPACALPSGGTRPAAPRAGAAAGAWRFIRIRRHGSCGRRGGCRRSGDAVAAVAADGECPPARGARRTGAVTLLFALRSSARALPRPCCWHAGAARCLPRLVLPAALLNKSRTTGHHRHHSVHDNIGPACTGGAGMPRRAGAARRRQCSTTTARSVQVCD